MTGMREQLRQLVPRAARRSLKIARARLTYRLGIERYTFPALHELDRRLQALLPESGIFLEVGANDGYSQSNTYHLEVVQGWSGILIEPSPTLFRTCARVRGRATCINVACVAPGNAGPVQLVDLDLMSVVLGNQPEVEERQRTGRAKYQLSVPSSTVSEVIDASPFTHIDFMSVDVEGTELALLSGLDLSRHAPDWLLVETAHPQEVEGVLSGAMDLVQRMTHHDYLFRRRCSG